jgi:hypothetical protein
MCFDMGKHAWKDHIQQIKFACLWLLNFYQKPFWEHVLFVHLNKQVDETNPLQSNIITFL